MATVIYPGPVFGPVKSRRLGKSLGVNLLPVDGKLCSFDCIYCECGLNDEHRPKLKMPSREEVREALEKRLAAMREADDLPEAITYSGNGEPTSHPDFLAIVKDTRALRDQYCPQAKVCLLTNATHLNRDDVFEAVKLIDRPCLKLDTVDADYIRFVDRPNCPYDVKTVIVGPCNDRPGTVKLGNNQSITQEEAQAFEDITNAGYTVDFRLIPDKGIGEWSKFRGKFGF